MSELTREYFDRQMARVAHLHDVENLASKEDLKSAVAKLATKQDIREGLEELAHITSAGFARTEKRFDEIEKHLDVSEQLKIFERKFKQLEEALHIKL